MRCKTLKAWSGGVGGLLDYYAGLVEDRTREVSRSHGPVDYYLDRQHTSRTVDPQLHTHAIVAAKVQDPTGRWLSLDARFLKKQQRTIGWIYDAALRAELTRRLGVTWERSVEQPADMTCVPGNVREVLSQRTPQVKAKHEELIRQWRDEHGGVDPDRLTIAGLQRKAARSSRPAKTHGVDGPALHDTWATQARAVGFEPKTLTTGRIAGRSQERRLTDTELIGEALRGVSEESSTWFTRRHRPTHRHPPSGRRSYSGGDGGPYRSAGGPSRSQMRRPRPRTSGRSRATPRRQTGR